MAREAITIIGTVVGAMVGQPGLGYMIGAAIGGAVDPIINKTQGPQIGDLAVQFSTWGVMIPYLYGTMRMAGNVIWSTDLIETANETSDDGKGGPVNENTTYSYSVNLAVSLCDSYGRPVAGIRKVWANGTLIYNAGDDANIETIIASQQMATGFKFYDGNDTQMPNPTMEADKGAGNVPAYRGQAIVVFEGLQLANYGNRVPNLEFEVIGNGGEVTVRTPFPTPPYKGGTTVQSSFFHAPTLSTEHNPVVIVREITGTELVFNYYQLYEDQAVKIDSTIYPQAVGDWNLVPGVSDEIGSLGSGIASGSIKSWVDINKVQLINTGSLGSSSMVYARNRNIIFTAAHASGYLRRHDVGLSASPPEGAPFRDSSAVLPGAASIYVHDGILHYLVNQSVARVVRVDTETLNVLSDITYPSTGTANNASKIYVSDNGKVFILTQGGSRIYELSGSVSSLVINGAGGTEAHSSFAVSNDADVAIIFGQISQPGGKRGNSELLKIAIGNTAMPISSIVSDQCDRAGVTDVDASGLTMSVHGYAIKRQGSARTNIDQLQKYGYFDAVESDNVLKFPVRGSDPIVTIPYEDLGAHVFGSAASNALDKIRAQETDLPRRIAVNYFNTAADYQAGSEHAQRLITESENETTVQLAVAMDSGKAAQIADVLLFDAYTSRTQFSFSTTSKYALLEPADVIAIEAPEATYTIRIISKDDSGSVKKFSAVLENVAGYSSNATGGSTGQSQNQIGAPGPTLMQLLDIPLIRDQDDGAGFYASMSGVRDAWRGASLLKSFDDLTFAAIGSVLNSAAMGYATTALGNWTGGNMFDESNTVDVTLYSGELISTDYLAVLNGANACVIGNEILQFKNAILIGAKQYRLSGFLRGRRGTEQHVGTHAVSERFVLMSVAGTLRPDGGAAEIGAQRYYKPVSFGQRQTDVASTPFTNTAVGLKPYSPVELRGGKQTNGDFIVSWTRRTRIDGNLRNLVNASLGETTEAYEIDIMSGATVKRTLASATPTVTYPAAMQTTDFGSVQANLSVRIYQISSTVGRGFPAIKTY